MTALETLIESASSSPPPRATIFDLPITLSADLRNGPLAQIRGCFGGQTRREAGIPHSLCS